MDCHETVPFWKSRSGSTTLYLILTACWIESGAVTYKPLPHPRPSDYDFQFHNYQTEVVFKNQVLPEDVEVTLYVHKEQTRKLIFMVENSEKPISLTITPCGVELEWRLLLRTFPTSSDYDEPWYNQVPNSEENDFPEIQTSYIGKDRRTYFHNQTPVGFYILELNSRAGDTSVRVLMAMSHSAYSYYPELPEEHKVRILKVRRDAISVSWRASPSSLNPMADLEYCVSANTQENFKTLCALSGETNEDFEPSKPSSPLHTKSFRKSTRKNVSKNFTLLSSNPDVQVHCIGKKTSYMFTNLEEGKQFFIDVFVINKWSNTSSNYKGAVATTKDIGNEDHRMKYNEMVLFHLKKDNKFTMKMRLPFSAPQGILWIYAQSCSGPGPVLLKITKGPHIVLTTEVMESKTSTLRNLVNGTYTIEVSSPVHKVRVARLWLSKKYHRFPYPSLPEDRKIKVFDTLTSCHTVTIAWKTTDNEKVRYCLYKRKTSTSTEKTLSYSHNSCDEGTFSPLNKDRILCRRFHRFSRYRFNDVIIQTIRGLTPGTTYVFEVLVTKLRGKQLPYDSVWVTTSPNCSNSSH